MARIKLDGVIEAVHRTEGGKIICVRAYERHGAVWSDRVLLEFDELSERLKQGKFFVVGERISYFGSTFNTGPAVNLMAGKLISEGQPSVSDLLTRVPVF